MEKELLVIDGKDVSEVSDEAAMELIDVEALIKEQERLEKAKALWMPRDRQNELKYAINTQIDMKTMVDMFGFEMKKSGKNTYYLIDDNSSYDRPSSCVLWDEPNEKYAWTWKRFSRDKTGGGAFNFYMHYKYNDEKQYYFTALNELVEFVDLSKMKGLQVYMESHKEQKPKENMDPVKRHKQLSEMLLDKAERNSKGELDMRVVFAYLHKTRGIDYSIIQRMVNDKVLFQGRDDRGNREVLFVGRDKFGHISGVSHRSTAPKSKFRGDFPNCDYSVGWFYDPQVNPSILGEEKYINFDPHRKLLCFESSIEMMSYMTLLKMSGKDWTQYAYLACSGISKNTCIDHTCEEYGYSEVVVMFNNDLEKKVNAGLKASVDVVERLSHKGIKTSILLPKVANDWNDRLKGLVAQKHDLSANLKKVINGEIEKEEQSNEPEHKKNQGIVL